MPPESIQICVHSILHKIETSHRRIDLMTIKLLANLDRHTLSELCDPELNHALVEVKLHENLIDNYKGLAIFEQKERIDLHNIYGT